MYEGSTIPIGWTSWSGSCARTGSRRTPPVLPIPPPSLLLTVLVPLLFSATSCPLVDWPGYDDPQASGHGHHPISGRSLRR